MTFRKGTPVTLEVYGAGEVTYEEYEVAYVSKGEVWLDNGPGNDPTGPFDQDGKYLGDLMFGFSFRVTPREP